MLRLPEAASFLPRPPRTRRRRVGALQQQVHRDAAGVVAGGVQREREPDCNLRKDGENEGRGEGEHARRRRRQPCGDGTNKAQAAPPQKRLLPTDQPTPNSHAHAAPRRPGRSAAPRPPAPPPAAPPPRRSGRARTGAGPRAGRPAASAGAPPAPRPSPRAPPQPWTRTDAARRSSPPARPARKQPSPRGRPRLAPRPPWWRRLPPPPPPPPRRPPHPSSHPARPAASASARPRSTGAAARARRPRRPRLAQRRRPEARVGGAAPAVARQGGDRARAAPRAAELGPASSGGSAARVWREWPPRGGERSPRAGSALVAGRDQRGRGQTRRGGVSAFPCWISNRIYRVEIPCHPPAPDQASAAAAPADSPASPAAAGGSMVGRLRGAASLLVLALCAGLCRRASADIVIDELERDPRRIVLVARPFGFQGQGGAGGGAFVGSPLRGAPLTACACVPPSSEPQDQQLGRPRQRQHRPGARVRRVRGAACGRSRLKATAPRRARPCALQDWNRSKVGFFITVAEAEAALLQDLSSRACARGRGHGPLPGGGGVDNPLAHPGDPPCSRLLPAGQQRLGAGAIHVRAAGPGAGEREAGVQAEAALHGAPSSLPSPSSLPPSSPSLSPSRR